MNTISNYIINNNNSIYCNNHLNTISNYIINNNDNSIYFNNSIITLSNNIYFNFASKNFVTQNYIPINSDIKLQNNFNTTAITNPTIINGICHAPGDGASYNTFNLAICSWYGIGFIDTCYKKCVIYFDVRSGNISLTG